MYGPKQPTMMSWYSWSEDDVFEWSLSYSNIGWRFRKGDDKWHVQSIYELYDLDLPKEAVRLVDRFVDWGWD